MASDVQAIQPATLTVVQAARLYGRSPRSFEVDIKLGYVPRPFWIGGRRFFLRSALLEDLEKRHRTAQAVKA